MSKFVLVLILMWGRVACEFSPVTPPVVHPLTMEDLMDSPFIVGLSPNQRKAVWHSTRRATAHPVSSVAYSEKVKNALLRDATEAKRGLSDIINGSATTPYVSGELDALFANRTIKIHERVYQKMSAALILQTQEKRNLGDFDDSDDDIFHALSYEAVLRILFKPETSVYKFASQHGGESLKFVLPDELQLDGGKRFKGWFVLMFFQDQVTGLWQLYHAMFHTKNRTVDPHADDAVNLTLCLDKQNLNKLTFREIKSPAPASSVILPRHRAAPAGNVGSSSAPVVGGAAPSAKRRVTF